MRNVKFELIRFVMFMFFLIKCVKNCCVLVSIVCLSMLLYLGYNMRLGVVELMWFRFSYWLRKLFINCFDLGLLSIWLIWFVKIEGCESWFLVVSFMSFLLGRLSYRKYVSWLVRLKLFNGLVGFFKKSVWGEIRIVCNGMWIVWVNGCLVLRLGIVNVISDLIFVLEIWCWYVCGVNFEMVCWMWFKGFLFNFGLNVCFYLFND